jgi:hypothetical protein
MNHTNNSHTAKTKIFLSGCNGAGGLHGMENT